MKFTACAWLGVFFATPSAALGAFSQSDPLTREYVDAREADLLHELVGFLALPNSAADTAEIERNAEALMQMVTKRGFDAEILRVEGSLPAVFARRTVPGAERTVTFYMHYDGQPADAANWTSPPFEPVLRRGKIEDGAPVVAMDGFEADDRLYARSASDDKSPIVALLWALDALDAAGVLPTVNIELFLEGEEEAGSSGLDAMMSAHRERLQSDLWLMADGPIEVDGRNRIILGVRGVRTVSLTLYGAGRALHSGHYGNVAPDTGAQMAHLLSSMRAPDGTILIDGWYDDFDPPEQEALDIVSMRGDSDRTLLDEAGIHEIEKGAVSYGEAIMYPSMSVVGLSTGAVGPASRLAIEPKSDAVINFRLGAGQDSDRIEQLFEQHVVEQGFTLVDHEPSLEDRSSGGPFMRIQWSQSGYAAMRTPVTTPEVVEVVDIARNVTGKEPFIIPQVGGSLPLSIIDRNVEAPLIVLPIVNPDNNQHAPDENVRMGHVVDGIELFAQLLTKL